MDLREEKALVGFSPTGHSGIHIQSLVVNYVRSFLAHSMPQLTDRRKGMNINTMKIQKLIAIVFFIFWLPALLSAEYVQLLLKGDQGDGVIEYSDTITLAEGDTAELISYFGDATLGLEVTSGSTTVFGRLNPENSQYQPAIAKRQFIGPATIKITNKYDEDLEASYFKASKILALFRISRTGSSEGAIIVPDDDPTATFEVFIEASTDLETWVRVIPGDYDASGGARFFRVRMVKK